MKNVVAHEEEFRRTYLRIGGDVFAVYGDRWRGFIAGRRFHAE